MKDEDNLYGENETHSTTHGRWHMEIQPQMHYKLLDGSKTIVIDQNSKVCDSPNTSPLSFQCHSTLLQMEMIRVS
jgi:hypothetical protein